MKNEIYLKLQPIERQLKSAQVSNYARLSASEFAQFCDTYKEHFGVELTRNEKNCNTCRLKAIKKIAADYFQYQEWYLNRWGRKPEDPKPEKETTPVEPVEPVENNNEENNVENKIEENA